MISFLDKYRKYKFLNVINGSHNINFILKEKFTSNIWIGKISKSLRKFGSDFNDLDERAIVTYRLGKKLNTCIPVTKYIYFNQVEFTPLFDEFLKAINQSETVLQDKLLITRFSGITLSNFIKFSNIEKIKNLNQVLNNFTFNLWVGNYDKKDQDYVIDNDLICQSIDYNLSGPGFILNKNYALGAYAQSYDLDQVEDSGWVISPIFLNYIKQKNYKIDFFEEGIRKIENFSNDVIEECFKGLCFYRQSSKETINEEFIKFLVERKFKLRKAIKVWCESGYLRGQRPKPKQEGIKDNIITN